MKPESFRDRVLGRWSSHPHWMRWRRRWFVWIAFLPLAIVVLLGVLAAGNYENWLALLRHAPRWLTALAVALAFGIGGMITLAVCARIGEWRASGGLKKVGHSTSLPIDPLVMVVALVLGAIGPFVLSRWSAVPPGLRFMFQLFAVFPLLGILLAIRVLDSPRQGELPDGTQYRVRKRPLWLVLLLAVLGLLALTVIHDVGLALSRGGLHAWAAGWIPWYSSLGRRFLGVAALVPLAFVLFALWHLWPAVVPLIPEKKSPRGEDGEGRTEKKPWWRRMVAWFRNLLGGRVAEAPPEGPTPPKWLYELQETLGESAGEVELIQLGANEVSPDSPRTDLKHVFGVEVPTMDQVRVLERFQHLYRRLVQGNGSDGDSSADLLVEGNPGSGKTTALLACAAYAAFVRGQRVLFLVPDSIRQEAVQDRIDLFLRKLRLNYYVQAGALGEDAVDRWLKGAEPIPHIIIGTVRAVERHLYGFQCTRDQVPQLRRLVLLPEVVVVDDFMDFDDPQRSHLPFLLDKQRLLLAAEYLPLQVVVSCRKLAELGEEILGKRLFTVKHLDKNRNVLSIKPRQGARAWRVRMQADDVPETVENLVVWCLRRGLDVVLYRKGIDEEQRETQQATLATRGEGRIVVLSDLERPLTSLRPPEVDAIFYQEALHEDICLALRLHAGNDQTVIFSVEPRGAKREIVSGIVPVVADRTATPLLVAHLNSVLRFLQPLAPIHADVWSKFGVDYRTAVRRDRDTQVGAGRFDVDLWEEQDYRAELWPYICLARPSHARQPVKVFGLPDPSWDLYRTSDGHRLLIGRSTPAEVPATGGGPDPRRGRRARWFDEQAEFGEVGEVDLAHAYQFKLLWQRHSIGLRTIEQERDGLIRLVSEVWHGSGADRYLPIYDLAWKLPAEQQGERFWGSPDDGLRWFELRNRRGEVPVNARIIGHMSEYAGATEIPAVSFEYPARFCGLVFHPTRLENLAEAIGAGLQGPWATGDDVRFWPSLTGALNYALRSRVPGIHYFARVAAFELAGESAGIGRAVAWFIEPTSGGRTASRVMADLLAHPRELDGFWKSARWFLDQLRRCEMPPHRFLRQMTRIGLQGDDRADRIDQALALIGDVRACGRARQQGSPGQVGT